MGTKRTICVRTVKLTIDDVVQTKKLGSSLEICNNKFRNRIKRTTRPFSKQCPINKDTRLDLESLMSRVIDDKCGSGGLRIVLTPTQPAVPRILS